MRNFMFIFLTILGLQIHGQVKSQPGEQAASKLRIGVGYFGENFIHPGVVLEFEYDRAYTPAFSLPLRANLGYHVNEAYHAFFLELNKGFSKTFTSGLFLEQSLGAGLMLKSYRTEMWYHDQFFNSIPHGNSPVMGFMPSVSFGAGYDLSREKDGSSLLWLRPKVYWDLGFRMLHQPYFALQLGFSQTIKTL